MLIRRPGIAAALALIGLAILPAFAAAAQSEAGEGQAILNAVQQGSRSCSQLTESDFELAGEAWMERMFGSSQAHESMNRLMSSMMGSSGEERMHEYMGRRATGCGGGSLPSGFGQMMNGVRGMMGMMAMMGGGSGAGGMMGAGGTGITGGGSMMGVSNGTGQSGDGDNDVSGWVVVGLIVLTALFLAAAYFIVRGVRSRSVGTTPAEILQRRLAAGEISREDYERRLNLLSGGR